VRTDCTPPAPRLVARGVTPKSSQAIPLQTLVVFSNSSRIWPSSDPMWGLESNAIAGKARPLLSCQCRSRTPNFRRYFLVLFTRASSVRLPNEHRGRFNQPTSRVPRTRVCPDSGSIKISREPTVDKNARELEQYERRRISKRTCHVSKTKRFSSFPLIISIVSTLAILSEAGRVLTAILIACIAEFTFVGAAAAPDIIELTRIKASTAIPAPSASKLNKKENRTSGASIVIVLLASS
jgi:hypothetical protein